ncbi:MAG: hypothetical protein HUU29_02495 [Planctomycetaceae bacterium]|nr:hypothetical protein [Planctomycetaceae bacterium]
MSERRVWIIVTVVMAVGLAALVLLSISYALEGRNTAFSIAAVGSIVLCFLTRNALRAALSELSPFQKWANDAIFSVLDDDDFMTIDDWKPRKVIPKLPFRRKACPQRGKVRVPKKRQSS